MQTFLDITLYAGVVLAGLSVIAFLFVMMGKLLIDNTYDPEQEHGH